MNDTTRWIMIILLLLLIAAAVFMLLRSPGKDNGDGTDAVSAGRDTDRDGLGDRQEDGIEPAAGSAGRGVYDQEADARAVAATDARAAEPDTRAAEADTRAAEPDTRAAEAGDDEATLPAGDRMDEYSHPDAVDDRDRDEVLHDDTAVAPVETAPHDDSTGAAVPAGSGPVEVPPTRFEDGSSYQAPVADEGVTTESRQETAAGWDEAPDTRAEEPVGADQSELATDVHPLTDAEIDEGGSTEPLTSREQEPVASSQRTTETVDDTRIGDQDGRTDVAGAGPAGAGPDPAAAATAGAAGAAVAGASAAERRDDDRSGRGSAGYEQGTLYDDRAQTREEEYPVGDESTTYRAADGEAVVVEDERMSAGWDAAPADGGIGAPQTADEIVEGRTDPDAAATGTTATADTATEQGPDTATDPGGYAPVHVEAAYGPGSAEPLEDGSGPAGWEIKGNIGSMLFHTAESPSYDAVRAEVWFESEDAARAAGFAHWDRRRR